MSSEYYMFQITSKGEFKEINFDPRFYWIRKRKSYLVARQNRKGEILLGFWGRQDGNSTAEISRSTLLDLIDVLIARFENKEKQEESKT